MSCGHCSAAIEAKILAADPVALISFDMQDRTVDVDTTLTDEELAAAVKDAGYASSPVN